MYQGMTLRNLTVLLSIALSSVALARPEPKLTTSIVQRDCERQLACLAPLYADLLAGQSSETRELRVDAVAVFNAGADRLASADRDHLAKLAASWTDSGTWTVITVEGYADARVRSATNTRCMATRSF